MQLRSFNNTLTSRFGGVVIYQTFNQMPDPHTWSAQTLFELQALAG